ncbi:MAG TPA: hypothetical protein VF794_29780 [Archangium sp.]|jgi:hypothetical protein|uniref:hypothetical protein n=1 Tax=Archangium sp. TaxID=1872627 RepID=UPI002ED97906
MRHPAHIAVGRLAATLLVVLWVAQPLLAIAHTREHVHRYCPTHRAFEEASTGGALARATKVWDGGTVEKLPPAPMGSPRHEECTVIPASGREELVGPTARPVVQACLAVSRPATAPPRPLHSLSVLDTAPKASPPARV